MLADDMTEEEVPWQQMSMLRMLTTWGVVACIVAALVCIANSSLTALGCLIFPFIMAWPVFAATLALGAFASIAVFIVFELLLLPLGNYETKERIYWCVRWIAFLTGIAGLLYLGGQGVIDGLRENRLVSEQVLYERCMAPKTRTIQDFYEECSDGWGSPAIGQRGACSHHGGVVRRWFERRETYQEHDSAFCLTDASNRSWLD